MSSSVFEHTNKTSKQDLYIVLSHLQPLKPQGRLRKIRSKMDEKLLHLAGKPKYKNVHFSHVEAVFPTKPEAEDCMQSLVPEGNPTAVPYAIHDPSGQEMGYGFQYQTSSGLQSYWLKHLTMQKPKATAGLAELIDRDPTEYQRIKDSPRSAEESESDPDVAICEAGEEGSDRGLLNGVPIDRNEEKIQQNLRNLMI